ncbi:F-box/FBD/LRR-repeat protein At5g53840 [Linum perenne]
MKKRPEKSAAAAGEDVISELPDEILHSIIGYIACSKKAAQTIVLSSRWRNLWRLYPVVQLNPKTKREFYSIGSEVFQKFHDATMKKYNQDKLLRMEALKLCIDIDEDHLSFPVCLEQLLELASERKAEYIGIEIGVLSCSSLSLPFRLLSNSSVKTLKLERIRFASCNDDLLVSLNSLRSLHLKNVKFDDQRLFTNLIASSPLLETLELESITGMENPWVSDVAKLKTLRFLHLGGVKFDEQLLADLIASSPLLETLKLGNIWGMRKLVVCNAANLKKLEIYHCYSLKEIQIAAFGLRHVRIENSFDLYAQFFQLHRRYKSSLRLGVISCGVLNYLYLYKLTLDDEQVLLNLIAANPLLQTLQLRNIKNLKKLQLSNVPDLKMLVVRDCNDLGEIEIAANPLLQTLQLRNIKNLKKLQLSNVPNLKTLVVRDCNDLEEIEIAAAYELHSLYLEKDFERSKSKRMLRKIELIAPQLNVLKIINYRLRMVDLKAIVCNLQYLEYLNLVGIAGSGRKKSWMLKFAGHKLEKFISWVSKGLKKIELDADAGPCVLNFLRSYKH